MFRILLPHPSRDATPLGVCSRRELASNLLSARVIAAPPSMDPNSRREPAPFDPQRRRSPRRVSMSARRRRSRRVGACARCTSAKRLQCDNCSRCAIAAIARQRLHECIHCLAMRNCNDCNRSAITAIFMQSSLSIAVRVRVAIMFSNKYCNYFHAELCCTEV